jgi:predicted secreted protein
MPIRVTVPPIDSVKVRVNTNPAVRVQSIQYLPSTMDNEISNATDVEFGSPLTARSVLTYDQTTEKFIVQDVPQINGGTF